MHQTGWRDGSTTMATHTLCSGWCVSTWKFEVPCMRGVEISWWMVERAREAEDRASCRVGWRQLERRGRGRNDGKMEVGRKETRREWKKEERKRRRKEDKLERTEIKDQKSIGSAMCHAFWQCCTVHRQWGGAHMIPRWSRCCSSIRVNRVPRFSWHACECVCTCVNGSSSNGTLYQYTIKPYWITK